MNLLSVPHVYVGPSVAKAEVLAELPGCIVRPPVARGDLYRDRTLRGVAFVIIDGVFRQEQAVSPRELVDVSRDGALVMGASSMGALRAAETWPAGVYGVGSIYRLFRSGALQTDDEVIVAYDDTGRSSVALVNVRYAAWRGVREGWLERATAVELVEAAQGLHFADRHWPLILRRLPSMEQSTGQRLASYDLKRLDALRALRKLRYWLSKQPSLLERPRRGAFVTSEESRERPHDASGLLPGALAPSALVEWLLASGRYVRYRAALGGAVPSVGLEAVKRLPLGLPDLEHRLLSELALQDELDAELFRRQAILVALAKAESEHVEPQKLHVMTARQTIAVEHGFADWHALERELGSASWLWQRTMKAAEELARARAIREIWFSRNAG